MLKRLKPFVRDRCLQLLERIDRRSYIALDHPPNAVNEPRWGWGRPEHAALTALLARHHDRYLATLQRVPTYKEELASIPLRRTGDGEPYWLSPWMPGLDAALLYTLTRDLRPNRYVEVGSGVSTTFVARARRDGGLTTTITSIDPQPRADIDALCDTVLRSPLERVDLGAFHGLERDDIVFVDNSHRVFMNSDVVTFFFDVVPLLPDGVVVGVHDVLLPSDYWPEWRELWFSEQYVLGAMLLAEAPFIEVVLPAFYVSARPELASATDPLFLDRRLEGVERRGWSFWFRIRRERRL